MQKYLTAFLSALFFYLPFSCISQPLHGDTPLTRQDTLRGSIGPGRDWWDVMVYKIDVQPDYKSKTIKGRNQISFDVTKEGTDKIMQVDLQVPMNIDSILLDNKKITAYKRDGNVYFIDFRNQNFNKAGSGKSQLYNLIVYFSGKPRQAINPPWDGGWIWTKDKNGNPWMSVACQGLGASVWYPCKDHQSDEPDKGAMLTITVPDTLVAVANGRLIEKKQAGNGNTSYSWAVESPINNYNIVPYIGKYVTWHEDYIGENEKKLDCDYWVLDYNLEKAKKQFTQAKSMLKSFEYWFGPYPFYKDGYKLVEAPHLGMEHQSATAYGNQYMNGYLGSDLSGTGWGKKWDYIIIHESGHEWFANNISTKDIADMWVHEGFTMYSEVLYTQSQFGKEAGNEYCRGIRNNISNDKPLIGPYGVNREGSGDMYNKGANLLHTIRQVINDDSLFRQILRGLNKDFYHQTVTSRQVEEYISKKAGKDFSKVFDQYLRTVKIPVLEYRLTRKAIEYRWNNVVEGFNLAVKLANSNQWITPSDKWKQLPYSPENKKGIVPDDNFYIDVRKVK
jgi:aminopeptidase N